MFEGRSKGVFKGVVGYRVYIGIHFHDIFSGNNGLKLEETTKQKLLLGKLQ